MPVPVSAPSTSTRSTKARALTACACAGSPRKRESATAAKSIEIIAAHVMTQEARVLSAYLVRVWITVIGAVLVTALLAWWVSSRGLAPLREQWPTRPPRSRRTLSARLDVANTPAELQSLAESFNAMLDRLRRRL